MTFLTCTLKDQTNLRPNNVTVDMLYDCISHSCSCHSEHGVPAPDCAASDVVSRDVRSHRSANAVCRMALVQVLFESHPGAAIPESDPELRAVLLDSLKTYEQDEAQRPAFEERPHIPVPETSSSTGKMPSPSRLLALAGLTTSRGLHSRSLLPECSVCPATVETSQHTNMEIALWWATILVLLCQ